jgi:hypothetical protein
MAMLADSEFKATVMMLLVGIFMGLVAGQLIWDSSEEYPVQVIPVGDRVIVVIKEYGKTAYVYTNRQDHFEFETELKPNSSYYPMPEKEISGRKVYSINPKFNEWVTDWKKINKLD